MGMISNDLQAPLHAAAYIDHLHHVNESKDSGKAYALSSWGLFLRHDGIHRTPATLKNPEG